MRKNTLSFIVMLIAYFNFNNINAQGIDFTLQNSNFPNTKSTTGTIAKGDVDKDGDIDIFISSGYPTKVALIYKNDGNGVFAKDTINKFDFTDSGFSSFADVDNDGDLDLLYTGRDYQGNNFAFLYINDGLGNFTLNQNNNLTKSSEGDLAFGDIDNDNDLDLIMVGYDSQNKVFSHLFQNDGRGNFTKLNTTSFQVGGGSVLFLDCDKDNDLDLLISGKNALNQDLSLLYKNNGLGVFNVDNSQNFIDAFVGDTEVGDSDNDGDLDILVNNFNATNLYINNGTGNFTIVNNLNLQAGGTGSVKFADFDNDGDNDIYINSHNSNKTTTKIYENKGLNSFIEVRSFVGNPYSRTVIADFNGDNLLDFIQLADSRSFYYLNSTSQITTSLIEYNIKNPLVMFPNPTEGFLTFRLTDENIQKIFVYNQIGVLIDEYNINNYQEIILNVESYNKGVYFVRILNSNNETSTTSFVKK